jgi:divalent metal cation (Fe/Co/Zn/Cd) transporter
VDFKTRTDVSALCPRATDAERVRHLRRGRRLEYFTLGWNMIEAVVAIGAGWLSGSVALVGFGVDSLIECASGSVMLWRFASAAHDEGREQRALRLVGLSLFMLSAYVCFEAVKSFVEGEPPEATLVGIGLSIASLVIMPLLARAKRRVAADLDSQAMVADSHQTDLCAYLSAILLVGLALNALFGWWWADPAAACLMVPIIAREGFEAWRGEACDDCHRS